MYIAEPGKPGEERTFTYKQLHHEVCLFANVLKRNGIKKGDRIVTQGGLLATVVNVAPDFLEIKLNEETKVKLRRSGVAEVLASEPQLEVLVNK